MKNVKRIGLNIILGATVAAVISGCGETASSDFNTFASGGGSGGSSGSGNDTLKVIKKADDRVLFQWKKNYSGYSEVLSRKEGVSGRSGYFMTQNATGSYELECTITDRGYRAISWGCVSTGSGYLASYAELGRMENDKYYNLILSQGFSHEEIDTGISLYYDSISRTIEVVQ
jgi:hypothetical protein